MYIGGHKRWVIELVDLGNFIQEEKVRFRKDENEIKKKLLLEKTCMLYTDISLYMFFSKKISHYGVNPEKMFIHPFFYGIKFSSLIVKLYGEG